jgi:hypothetical protein
VEHYARLLQEAAALFIVLWCVSVVILVFTVAACALVYALIRCEREDCAG